jgi:predicted amidophosphoribosyltransferase
VTEALKASIRKPLPHILEDALLRTRDTVPQTQLSRKQRLTNVVGCFAVASEVRTQIHGAHIVIIDDVITTGATLAEARLTLLRAGASRVDVLAFARS